MLVPRSLLFVLRALVAVFALHFSGALHGALDLERTIVGAPLHDEDDCSDDGNDHCPANCPNCHCAHGAPSLPPRPPVQAALLPLPAVPSAIAPSTVAPSDRPLPPLFRPPRATT